MPVKIENVAKSESNYLSHVSKKNFMSMVLVVFFRFQFLCCFSFLFFVHVNQDMSMLTKKQLSCFFLRCPVDYAH